jgi:PEGA domain
MKRHLPYVLLPVIVLLTLCAWPKEKNEPALTLFWPDPGSPTLKLAFGKFIQTAEYAGQKTLVCEVVIQNVSQKRIPSASLTVRMLDKNRVRVADSVLNITDLGPGESSKIPLQVFASGMPASLSLVAHNDSAGIPTSLKTIPLRVISVPPGATLKVDRLEAGMAPKVLALTVGNHTIEFSKEGYATGRTPVDITADELPGGSITLELGGLSQDTVELRDGTAVLGDVVSLSATSIVVRVNGAEQTYERNRVKEISLVERETLPQPAVVVPAPGQK